MKRFVWFTGLVGLLTVAQTLQAVTMKGLPSNQPLYSYSKSVADPKSTALGMPRSSGVTGVPGQRNKSVVAPLLSSMVYGPLGGRSASLFGKYGYSPQPLNQRYVPKSPVKPAPVISVPAAPGDPVTVPDGGATASLLGIALLGTALVKRTAGS